MASRSYLHEERFSDKIPFFMVDELGWPHIGLLSDQDSF
jgi:hypothetical protein